MYVRMCVCVCVCVCVPLQTRTSNKKGGPPMLWLYLLICLRDEDGGHGKIIRLCIQEAPSVPPGLQGEQAELHNALPPERPQPAGLVMAAPGPRSLVF